MQWLFTNSVQWLDTHTSLFFMILYVSISSETTSCISDDPLQHRTSYTLLGQDGCPGQICLRTHRTATNMNSDLHAVQKRSQKRIAFWPIICVTFGEHAPHVCHFLATSVPQRGQPGAKKRERVEQQEELDIYLVQGLGAITSIA